MEQFFTRQKANEGKKLFLFEPSGSKTEHYLKVLGIDSDSFKAAEVEAKRKSSELGMVKDNYERSVKWLEIQRELIAELVVDWSFEQPCTKENVINFLKEAPQIEEQINSYCGKRTLFFA